MTEHPEVISGDLVQLARRSRFVGFVQPDGNPVWVNVDRVDQVHPRGDHATYIGFAGAVGVDVQGSVVDVLAELDGVVR